MANEKLVELLELQQVQLRQQQEQFQKQQDLHRQELQAMMRLNGACYLDNNSMHSLPFNVTTSPLNLIGLRSIGKLGLSLDAIYKDLTTDLHLDRCGVDIWISYGQDTELIKTMIQVSELNPHKSYIPKRGQLRSQSDATQDFPIPMSADQTNQEGPSVFKKSDKHRLSVPRDLSLMERCYKRKQVFDKRFL
eukprot:gene17679-9334_t